MKNTIILKIIALAFVSFFTACGSSGSDSPEAADENVIADVRLEVNESVLCTSETTFTVTPSVSEPEITVTQDVSSGDTTILVNEDTSGYVDISNCTQK